MDGAPAWTDVPPRSIIHESTKKVNRVGLVFSVEGQNIFLRQSLAGTFIILCFQVEVSSTLTFQSGTFELVDLDENLCDNEVAFVRRGY